MLSKRFDTGFVADLQFNRSTVFPFYRLTVSGSWFRVLSLRNSKFVIQKKHVNVEHRLLNYFINFNILSHLILLQPPYSGQALHKIVKARPIMWFSGTRPQARLS